MIKDSDQIVWIILNAVKDAKVGKYKLAEFLKGSKSKNVEYLSAQAGYGGLLWYDIPTIMGFIEQLEQMEFIARAKQDADSPYSALELTSAGKKILNERVKVELQIIIQKKQIMVGDSEKATLNLLKTGKTIDEIAAARGFAISTIYDHLYKLVAVGYLSSLEFVPQDIISQILEAKRKLPNAAKLKEIKEILPENVTYGQIRCVSADKTYIENEKPNRQDVNKQNF